AGDGGAPVRENTLRCSPRRRPAAVGRRFVRPAQLLSSPFFGGPFMRRISRVPSVVLALLAVASSASAQPNVVPGTDVRLGILGSAVSQGHIGSFPNGEMSLAMA